MLFVTSCDGLTEPVVNRRGNLQVLVAQKAWQIPATLLSESKSSIKMRVTWQFSTFGTTAVSSLATVHTPFSRLNSQLRSRSSTSCLRGMLGIAPWRCTQIEAALAANFSASA